jgi:pyruvate/2-oxoglutarate dehydrogenase complex dihydrolipoamide dehydrogenase (E3) component
MDIDEVTAEGVDAVIVACGSTPRMDGIQISNPGEPIEGVDQSHVLSSNDLFEGGRYLGKTAVVIDDAGHYEGIAAAEFLLSKGLEVTYVSRHVSFAPRVEAALMTEAALQRLDRGHFRQMLRSRGVAIEKDTVVIAPSYVAAGSNVSEAIAADTVVLISLNRPNRDLYDALVGQGADVRVVGDANSPRFLSYATRDGHVAGASV